MFALPWTAAEAQEMRTMGARPLPAGAGTDTARQAHIPPASHTAAFAQPAWQGQGKDDAMRCRPTAAGESPSGNGGSGQLAGQAGHLGEAAQEAGAAAVEVAGQSRPAAEAGAVAPRKALEAVKEQGSRAATAVQVKGSLAASAAAEAGQAAAEKAAAATWVRRNGGFKLGMCVHDML